jgi:ubiquinone/menaquinone biosynthesis C-methylase UbiE
VTLNPPGQYADDRNLRALRDRQVTVVGCDRSLGMLQAAAHPALLSADVTALPLRDGVIDVALAIHMLYHVPDREAVIDEQGAFVTYGDLAAFICR